LKSILEYFLFLHPEITFFSIILDFS
jgi:hypothetical protein